MKKAFAMKAILFITAAALHAATITLFSDVTSAKLKSGINSVMYGSDGSCYPGIINVTVGAIDYQGALDMMVDPFAENAIWQTVVGTLAPGALSFDFSMTGTMDGADVASTIPGDPYEFDITSLMQQVVADGNLSNKSYAFCFMCTGGAGKINLFSSETSTPYADLVNIEVRDANGPHVFKYNKAGGDPVNNIHDRIQYTGHRTAHSQNYNDAFVVGGHTGAPSGDYVGIVQDRSAFFFHRGLASNLNWIDPIYPSDTIVVGIEKDRANAKAVLTLQNMPNPFSGSTRITYNLDKNARVRLGVYDVTGRLVTELENGVQKAGAYDVSWNGLDAPLGMYVLRLKAGERTLTRKMMIIQ